MQARLCVRTIAPLAALVAVSFTSAGSQPLFVPAFQVPWDDRSVPTSLAAVDLDADGRPDLVSTRCRSTGDCGHVAVMLGDADGTFRRPETYPSGARIPGSLAVADVNGDGPADVIVADHDSGNVVVALGRGDGSLRPAIAGMSEAGRSNDLTLTAIALADMDGDGRLDLVRARHHGGSQVSAIDVAWGRGDGRFEASAAEEHDVVFVDGRSTSLAVADVNDDGQPDVAVFGRHEGQHRVDVLLGPAPGFQRRHSVRLETHRRDANAQASDGSIAIADVDGDQRPDLLVTACPNRTCDARMLTFSGNGDGTFRAPERHGASGPGTGLLATADVNRDGLVDVVVSACRTTTCRSGSFEVLLHSALSPRTADVSSTLDAATLDPAAALVADAPTPAVSTPGAAAYNIRIVTDASPDVTDLPGLIHSTTSRWTSSRDKVWALFYWSHILKRQTTPIRLHGFEVTDPIRNFADFGFTQCSTISGINQVLYEALGLRHQYWDICNHTVSAVEYDGGFHMVDSSMSNLVTTDDGVTLASVTEAAADSARLVRERSLHSTSPNGFLTGSDTLRSLPDVINPVNGAVTSGFARAFCENDLKFRDYFYNWNSGHRHVLNLRDDESYTRYYRRLGTTSDYWVGNEQAGNPGVPVELDPTNRFNLKGNGSWTFSPSLTAAAWQRGVHSATNIVAAAAGLRPGVANQAADLIYKVQAGNIISSQNIQAEFSRTDPQAAATLAVSLNHGLTWIDVGDVGPSVGAAVPVTVPLRSEVNGAYEVLIRLRMRTTASVPAGVMLTRLRIDTVTQVNVQALPRLNLGRNEIVVGAGDQSDTMVLWPDLRGDLWRRDVHEFQNIGTQAATVPLPYRAVAYPAVPGQDGHLTYRMEAPTDITRLVYGGRLYNYSPGSYIDYLHSFDGGATWIRSYRLSTVAKPYDVMHYQTVTDVPAGARTVLFRFLMHSTATTAGRASGPYSLRIEASHRAPGGTPRALDVTWRWNEVRPDRTLVARSHKQRIGAFPLKYVINVGGADHPVMESLRVSVESTTDPEPYGYGDRLDVGGEKFVHAWRTEGANYALGRPHTMSRAPSGFQSSAPGDNTTILTDGVVGAPATGGISYWWGQCWSSGSNVDLQIDLGGPRSIGAFRAHLFGYPGWDALKGQVQDRVEVLTSSDNVEFESHGTLETSLWRKDVPINHMLQDDGRATAWNFERTLGVPVVARYVRYRATPKRNMCISELQVFDRISRVPFDLRIALPSGETSVPVPDVEGLTEQAAVAAVTRAGLVAGAITTASSATVPEGIVLDQSPAGGAALSPGGVVSLVVSSGAPAGGGVDEIVLHVAGQAEIIGGWAVTPDNTAAGGARLQNPNAGAPKKTTALAAPSLAFDVTFHADAGKAYRLWLRGKAIGDSYQNDSVFAQFSGSVTAAGTPQWRIGTTDATVLVLEDCGGCPPRGWGWTDNGYGPGVLGPLVHFAASGSQRLRIQAREDGLGIDQIVLSAVRFKTATPGSTTDDATILPLLNSPPAVQLTQPAAGTTIQIPAAVTVEATATDTDDGVAGVEFFAGGTSIGVDSTFPYSVTWTPSAPGTYLLTARAHDERGASTTSAGRAITVLPGTSGVHDEIVLHVAGAAAILGRWSVVADATAAGGARLQNLNYGAATLATPLAAPQSAFDLTFTAEAGKPYRLWLRGKALLNNTVNDSVYVQFDGSVTASGTAQWRIGTTSATTIVLQDCSGCPLQGWGWADNGYGTGVMGPLVYFAQDGVQRLRIQVREDGLGIDQVVLSAVRFLNASPGATTNDATILPATIAQ